MYYGQANFGQEPHHASGGMSRPGGAMVPAGGGMHPGFHPGGHAGFAHRGFLGGAGGWWGGSPWWGGWGDYGCRWVRDPYTGQWRQICPPAYDPYGYGYPF